MGLDIRLPIGLLFTVLGVLLVPTGLLSDTALNLWTGTAMLCFGAPMLWLGWRGQRILTREELAAEAAAKARAEQAALEEVPEKEAA